MLSTKTLIWTILPYCPCHMYFWSGWVILSSQNSPTSLCIGNRGYRKLFYSAAYYQLTYQVLFLPPHQTRSKIKHFSFKYIASKPKQHKQIHTRECQIPCLNPLTSGFGEHPNSMLWVSKSPVLVYSKRGESLSSTMKKKCGLWWQWWAVANHLCFSLVLEAFCWSCHKLPFTWGHFTYTHTHTHLCDEVSFCHICHIQ